MGGIPDVNSIFRKCEELGEEEVRRKLAQGIYASEKVPVINEWLTRQESARETDVKERELSIAEKSADAAQKSVTLTKANVVLTAIAVTVSIISLIFSLKACQ